MATLLELQHFAVLQVAYLHKSTSIEITCTTNNPCHLTCYYTDKPPVRHSTSLIKRGVALPWGAYFCFVAWNSVEQQEAGDTLIHTFEVPDWSFCQTKWFTFRGTVADALSPSVTALIKHHHPGEPPLPDLIPNKGWEAGNYPEYGGWTHTGSPVLASRYVQPRTGTYALRGYTPSGTTQWGKVTHTITDPSILARLAGKELVFSAWTWCTLRSPLPDLDNHREIEVGDNIDSTITDIPKLPYETWQQITAVHTITANPSFVFFSIYYYKAGARAIYEINVDDMDAYLS